VGGERRVGLTRVDGGSVSSEKDLVAVEEALTLNVDGRELVTLLYTPPMALELTLGYLFSEGLIKRKEDVSSLVRRRGSVMVELSRGLPKTKSPAARTLASGCGGGSTFIYPHGIRDIKKIRTNIILPQESILDLASEFRKKSELFEATGGVHSAGLSDGKEFLAFADDIGRHNAVDKVIGVCLVEGVRPEGSILFSTGRISSEILLKCARMGIPVVVSRSAPTSLAVSLGERLGVTVLGFVRGRRMNIYTHPERIGV